MNFLRNIKISVLKGVGPKKEQLLNKLNIYSIFDLLTYYPKSYEDMSQISMLKNPSEEKGLFHLEVISPPTVRQARGGLNILTVNVTDGVTTGELIYFNQPFMEKYFKKGYKLFIYGNVKKNGFTYQISSGKIMNRKDIGGLNPVYGLTSGLSNNEISKFTLNAIKDYKDEIIDILPIEIKNRYNLLDLNNAIEKIHFPESIEILSKCRNRLAFDELLILQSVIEGNSFRNKLRFSPKMEDIFEDEITSFIKNLSFTLTNAQIRVISEIIKDMTSPMGMDRLLQGDVGSGKTVVASVALLFSKLNGYQSALMAPTEILARQHYNSIILLFENMNINVELLTGDIKPKDKEIIVNKLQSGEIDIIVGTHALIQENVKFNNLALTIIDEQHRFGVNQRRELYLKGKHPHNLVMTATPIPRTLALVIYGDMEISVIDELPPGRKHIDTFVVDYSYMDRLDKFIINQIKEGRQVFVVCPLIEESDMPLKSLEEVFKHYTSDKFVRTGIKTRFLHGKMKNDEKQTIMEEFSRNEIQILVSTTVIEVGIDVPNASLMIIYDADRFGLSQLHQLRGRVGRGTNKAFCVLINNNKSEQSYKRMKVMQQSNDGFFIAEIDLELRGQGELMGTRQHGVPDLKFINLKLDSKLIELIKRDYKKIISIIDNYPILKKELNKYVEEVSKTLNSEEN